MLRFLLLTFLSLSMLFCGCKPAVEERNPAPHVRKVLAGSPEERAEALDILVKRGKQDIISSLILTLRFRKNELDIARAISSLAGHEINDWFEAMLWQQEHPEVISHDSFRSFKLELLEYLDPGFLRFLEGDRSDPEKMKIRLEEITWGGVKVDGIPALDNPTHIPADEADYLLAEDLVFGVYINGEARAYPLRILGWHEMANDRVGGVAVALSYCTLCRTGILYETELADREKPLLFGSSGLLYRSNKLMFDRETDSLWNQFTGKPITGPLVESNIVLKPLPMSVQTWSQWKEAHPETLVMDLNTGFDRDYGSGVAYKKYYDSPDLMFPVKVVDRGGLQAKELVFGITDFNISKAWPLAAFTRNHVINDRLGEKNIVLLGNPATRTVRAYGRGDRTFSRSKQGQLESREGVWRESEEFLIGPGNQRLPRLPGRLSYWFAWDSFMGKKSELYGEK